jgi:hypothetical protein
VIVRSKQMWRGFNTREVLVKGERGGKMKRQSDCEEQTDVKRI